ncbi:MAG: hypothetical protein INH34_18150 [Phycisphaerales bacterium]|nr:hypothetical protein [Phycisphaerales bacterium]
MPARHHAGVAFPLSSLVFAAAVAMAAPLAAQTPPSRAAEAARGAPAAATAATAAAWDAFVRAHGTAWIARWHAPTGTPRAIFGHGYELADWRDAGEAEARRHAHRELQRHAELLGLGASDFPEAIGARMGRTWTFSFRQTFRGLDVIDGRADVRIHMVGRVVHLGSTAWPVPVDFDVTPTLGEAAAAARAWLHLGREPGAVPQPGRPRPNRLVVVGVGDDAATAVVRLAWEIPVSAVAADGSGPIGRVYVDARTGGVLRYVDDKHACGIAGCSIGGAGATADRATPPVPTTVTVRGWTATGFSPVSPPTNAALPGIQVAVPGFGVQTTDQFGQFTIDLTAPLTVTAQVDGQRCNLVFGPGAPLATANLQPGVPATLQFGSATGGEQPLAHTTAYYWTDRVNTWARGVLGNSPQLAIADNVQPTVNMTSTCNAYYVGNSINFYGSGGGCNNTSAASVVAHEWGHGLDDRYGGISQTNGLSEGWGDICSMYLLDDPQIGHDFFSGGGGIRSGNNGQQYPNGSGPHAQGESWMGFAWKFRQNLRAALGTAQALTLSDAIVVGSIAANAQNQPDAVVAAFQADDNDGLLGNGTPNYVHLAAACNAHSLPYPQIVAGYVQNPTLLGTTFDQGMPRNVQVDAVPIVGGFAQVRVHWSTGGGVWQQRAMIPAGPANRWQALLPGQLAPSTVQYHFEAAHATGATFRMPATGEYGYTTLSEKRIWLDGFEQGGAGWTHGATTGADDWQIGPAGGVVGWGWSDPATAATGTAIAGTNLTNGGAYPASTDSWLRSPPIDCTGYPTVRVRFKRWISCAGPSDRLELRIGGLLTWATSFAPVSETGWSTFETIAPNGGNNPALVLEFRLVSDSVISYGGWQIDDVEVFSLNAAVPPPARLALLPEQTPPGAAVTAHLQTAGAAPFLLLLGDTAGPTAIPLPGMPLRAGGNVIALFGATDAQGVFTSTFASPPAPLTGSLWHSQALTLDAQGAIVATNAFLNLFTP